MESAQYQSCSTIRRDGLRTAARRPPGGAGRRSGRAGLALSARPRSRAVERHARRPLTRRWQQWRRVANWGSQAPMMTELEGMGEFSLLRQIQHLITAIAAISVTMLPAVACGGGEK